MKRNMDLVRQLLLEIEELNAPGLDELLDDPDDAEERAIVGHHIRILQGGGFLTGYDAPTLGRETWYELQLTWQGYEFLDTVRSQTTWERVKRIAGEAGVMSSDALLDIGKAVVASAISGVLKIHGIG